MFGCLGNQVLNSEPYDGSRGCIDRRFTEEFGKRPTALKLKDYNDSYFTIAVDETEPKTKIEATHQQNKILHERQMCYHCLSLT